MDTRQTNEATRRSQSTRIVVGLDESTSAAAALRWAAHQARATGSPLRVVHARVMDAFASSAASQELIEAEKADAGARATRWVIDILSESVPDVQWSLDVEMGPAGPALVTESRNAQMLVVGTQEHTGVRRAVLGSVSHYCLTHAATPVVAVPAPRRAVPSQERTERDLVVTPGPLL